MKKLWMILGIACLCTGLFAETQEEKLARLEKKIDQLEKAVQPLLAQQKKQEITQEQQKEARKRMGKDSGNYSKEQLREIEQMYQAWRKVPETERIASLKALAAKYPKSNRAGCAWLYAARWEKPGKTQIEDLKRAIDGFGDCRYGDGVQVGAYARFVLGKLLEKDGKKEEAQKYFNELKTSFPNAIDHSGNLLIERL